MDCDGILDKSRNACNRTAAAWNDVCASAPLLHASHTRCRASASCRYGPGPVCTRTRNYYCAADTVIWNSVCAARSQRLSADGAAVRSRFAAVLWAEKFRSALKLGIEVDGQESVQRLRLTARGKWPDASMHDAVEPDPGEGASGCSEDNLPRQQPLPSRGSAAACCRWAPGRQWLRWGRCEACASPRSRLKYRSRDGQPAVLRARADARGVVAADVHGAIGVASRIATSTPGTPRLISCRVVVPVVVAGAPGGPSWGGTHEVHVDRRQIRNRS